MSRASCTSLRAKENSNLEVDGSQGQRHHIWGPIRGTIINSVMTSSHANCETMMFQLIVPRGGLGEGGVEVLKTCLSDPKYRVGLASNLRISLN